MSKIIGSKTIRAKLYNERSEKTYFNQIFWLALQDINKELQKYHVRMHGYLFKKHLLISCMIQFAGNSSFRKIEILNFRNNDVITYLPHLMMLHYISY